MTEITARKPSFYFFAIHVVAIHVVAIHVVGNFITHLQNDNSNEKFTVVINTNDTFKIHILLL